MKKGILVGVVLVVLALTAGIIIKQTKVLDKEGSYGVIMYGYDQTIEDYLSLLDSKGYEVIAQAEYKIIDTTMILKVSDVDRLAKLGIVSELKDDQVVPVSSYTLSKGEIDYWADTLKEQITLNSKEIEVTYKGNLFLGMNKAIVDDFLIVEDSSYNQMQSDILVLKVLKFKKNPESIIESLEGIEIQLTDFHSLSK